MIRRNIKSSPASVLPFIALLFLSLSGCATNDTWSSNNDWSTDSLAAALAASGRPDSDKARDTARKPAEVLVFLGVEPGMTALDVMAAGGYYTEVLSVAVGESGTVYAQNPPWMLEFMKGAIDKAMSQKLADNRLPNVVRTDGSLDEVSIAEGSVDLAFTALNFHDAYFMDGPHAAMGMLQQIYDLLKPGGVLGLIDHIGDPNLDNEKLHRIPKQDVLDLMDGVGFVLEAESTMLAHPDDDMNQMVFAKSVRGKTDRFVLKLRKPK